MLQSFLVLLVLFALNSSLESKDGKGLRTYRESEEKTRVDDILHELQGICLNENEYRDVTQLKKDTQSILKRICGRSAKYCTEIKKSKAASGVYQIFPKKKEGVKVYCDMDTDGGGGQLSRKDMTILLTSRELGPIAKTGSVTSIENIGLVGNTHIHRLTSSGTYELRIDLTDKNNKKKYATYKTFVVKDAASQYKLTIGGYSGDAGIMIYKPVPTAPKHKDRGGLTVVQTVL
ncbi:unnamed protein product [Mytilus coruscus]|uniref:Fibrinogen C-terminal domain-containing protein n=1 Tax=Mytilus coruscus TaxID=42192 RepID=A0A6J8ERK2_MYTCO|nr:unnamed protein product [Mytilus coruscus]